MGIRRLTVGQAIVEFLVAQQSARDGVAQPFFHGVFGIFGHGNVAGLGEALLAARDRIRFYLPRNEQAMVHTAAAFAKMRNRLQTFACTSSIGPGATNMLTAAAGATINRLPVLLLPGDIFATRRAAPVRAARVFLRSTCRSTTASSRCRDSGIASTGPSSSRRHWSRRCGC